MQLDPSNVEDCHWVASRTSKMVIIKLSRCKDANKIRRVKKSLKNLNLSSLGIKNPVFINDSLCSYYKMLWSKCKNLSSNKSIYIFWVSNGSFRLKIGENDRVNIKTHLSDLVEMFARNKLFSSDIQGALYFHLILVYILIGLFGLKYITILFFVHVLQHHPSICFLRSDPSINCYHNLC